MTAPEWPKPMPVVEVLWVDSMSHGGWQPPSVWQERFPADYRGGHCRTVGYLYHQDMHRVVIMQSQAAWGSLADALEIPRVAVKAMRVIETAAVHRRALQTVPLRKGKGA